ncbi:amidohydrolase family protein [Arthrobacter sp. ISL-48]|uniref:amidohydrolase family protein n=1 Tax=Arthrobacter sp. ISL-48 TaxID=2819110 RepID=UPI001BE586D4|nr:amidohydrolase family protein [Arthrobacter sp. ISL-48]MBT2534508.1 amidohydrolase family protein [Arthrobacter sp. ISL-48]
MKIIDAQIHLWNGQNTPPHHLRTPYTIDRALREMDEAGVDRAINCPAIWDPTANDYAIEAALQHPDRFATMGWLPLDGTPDESLVDEWMEKPGMLGLRFLLYAPNAGNLISSGAFDWVWAGADRLEIPVALMVMPQHLSLIRGIAQRYPAIRLMLDHLLVSPFEKVPAAVAHLDDLLELASLPNVAVKASGVASMATDDYPYTSTHDVLRRTFDAYGPHRMFWGSDITRFDRPWAEHRTMFTDHLPWLSGSDLELVMGRGVAEWTGWS